MEEKVIHNRREKKKKENVKNSLVFQFHLKPKDSGEDQNLGGKDKEQSK